MPLPPDPISTAELRRDPLPSVETAETVAPTDSPTPLGLTFAPPTEPGEIGTLGPYRVQKLLGKGGMGAVYLATDTRLGRKLALKIMLPSHAADRDSRERFVREARAAAQITHDNVVTVYEADERNGVPYIAMQFLQGCPLNNYLRDKGPPPLVHAVRIAREAALGLAAAHDLGLVHRDIKPANLWLEAPHGRVKVLDFGLAKALDGDSELSGSGTVLGTPAYMSPEQARSDKVDHRTDLFSLGVVLYQLCTGERPFSGPTPVAALMALGSDDPTPVRDLNPEVPASLAALIHQLLAKRPSDRPPNAAEVARRLRAVRDELLAGLSSDVSTSLPVVVAYPLQQVDAPMVIAGAQESVFAGLDDGPTVDTNTPRAERPPAGRGALVAAAVAVALAAVVVVGVIVASQKKKGTLEPPPESPTVANAPGANKDVKPAGAPKPGVAPVVPPDPTADLTGWTALVPTVRVSEGGANLVVGKDGAVLVSGPFPENDVYTLVFPATPKTFAALRLDVMPHESLERGGPGRNGDFVLTTIRARLDSPKPRALKFGAAEDSNRAGDALGSFAIDDTDGTGWSAPAGRSNHAVFTFDEPVSPNGAALRVTLEFKHNTHHRVLGHFRLLAK